MLVPVVRWVLARLVDGAAWLVASWWWSRRELAENRAAWDLDTGRFPEPEP